MSGLNGRGNNLLLPFYTKLSEQPEKKLENIPQKKPELWQGQNTTQVHCLYVFSPELGGGGLKY